MNISRFGESPFLMEALVNDAGAEDLLDFYRLVEMSADDIDSLEVTTSEGRVPLAAGYKTFIRNFQGMYSVCEKQTDWRDGMILALGYRDYRAYMHITSRNSLCCSGNIPWTISINPLPPWVPPSNLTSRLPSTPSLVGSIVESKEKMAPKGIVDKDIGGEDAITAKGIKEIPSISSRLLAIPDKLLTLSSG